MISNCNAIAKLTGGVRSERLETPYENACRGLRTALQQKNPGESQG